MNRSILCQFVVVLLALNVSGCDPVTYNAFQKEKKRAEGYWAGLQEAQDQAPIVQQFIAMFPTGEIRYRYFDGSKEPGFDGYVLLHGRYELTMQLPVVFDAAGRHVIDYGEPQFYLHEITQFERLPGGGAKMGYGSQCVFGSAEWEKLVESSGDFSVLDRTMTTDQPIPGVDAYDAIRKE